MKQRLVVIGNGMAGVRTVEEIIKRNPKLYTISIVGSESHPNYNRILLSSVLQGEASFNEIIINQQDWYRQNGITLFIGEEALAIDPEKKEVKTNQNRILYYDKLIIATGSVPFVLPIPGADKEGVITFRTIEDCKKIIHTSKRYKQAAVIGGGILGLEAARGLLHLGLKVKVIHNVDHLMQRQLDANSSKLLQHSLEQQGIECFLGKGTREIVGEKRVEKIVFTDGAETEADLVVMAVGVKPNIALARESGIATNHGIIVNDFLETNMADVYGVGECVEHNGVVYGLVKPLYEQGKVLANHLCGMAEQGYGGSTLSTSLKIPGIDLFSIGHIEETDELKMLKLENQLEGIYKKIIFQDDRIVGAVLYGDTSSSSKLLDMIAKRKHVNDEEKELLLQTKKRDVTLFQSMNQAEIICHCHAVTKGGIVEAVLQKDLTTVGQVKQCTKASSSCGGCKPMVSDLLAYIHSEQCNESIVQKALCNCTTFSEEEVVYQIQQLNLFSLQSIFSELKWNTVNGCTVCKPALQFYLAMIYPDSGDDFVVNWNGARLQRDGTYSIVLQTNGGGADFADIQKLSKVMSKYQIRKVGFTPEQRLQLIGIKREMLPKVYDDLGIPPTPSFRHAIHFVNTFYGEQSCHCNDNLIRQVAIDLERELTQIFTPHHIVIGFSACKHREKELMIKDICIVCDKRGFEMYMGGSISHLFQKAELFAVSNSSLEVKKYICSFIQYYRETANYLESIADWMKRVGMIHIREVIFERSICEQLIARLKVDKAAMLESKEITRLRV